MDKYRYVCFVIIEAKSPIMIGSGYKSITTDAELATDVNELPYIPGTSLAGALRSGVVNNNIEVLFGSQNLGSCLMFSDGYLIGNDGEPIIGLTNTTGEFYDNYRNLPKREHVRINDKGVAEAGAKYDNRVVYKGSRFCFEVELLSKNGSDSDKKSLENIILSMSRPSFRIGAGGCRGYGAVEIIECYTKKYNLGKTDDISEYIKRSSRLCMNEQYRVGNNLPLKGNIKDDKHFEYILSITPEDLFVFGSGKDENKDKEKRSTNQESVKERIVTWVGSTPTLSEPKYFIPASSIKGIVYHRTLFHYNRFINNFIKTNSEELDANAKAAMIQLWGSEDDKNPKRGSVLLQDFHFESELKDKIVQHVKIDRFTGGAMTNSGALFSEKVLYSEADTSYKMQLIVEKQAFEDNKNLQKAFELALIDITEGQLPLGWGVNKGHGRFNGSVTRDSITINRKKISLN